MDFALTSTFTSEYHIHACSVEDGMLMLVEMLVRSSQVMVKQTLVSSFPVITNFPGADKASVFFHKYGKSTKCLPLIISCLTSQDMGN